MGKGFVLKDEVPTIHNTEELELYLHNPFVINRYMVDVDTYETLMKEILNLLRACFRIRECREYPVKFKFDPKDKTTYTLELRFFYVNIILWYPFVEVNEFHVLDESFILDCTKDVPQIEDYINYKLITQLRDCNVKSTTVNYLISEVLYNLRLISIDFSLIMGLNFSAVTFLDMYESNEEIREMMEVQFDETMQPHEIEQKLNELQDREISIYKSIIDNPIGVILRTGTGIKLKQLTEFTISEGLKPSLEGVTIPKPIENSTLLRGLDRPSYLYIDAIGARKSLIMNKKVINLLLPVTLHSNMKLKNLFNCWKLLRALSTYVVII